MPILHYSAYSFFSQGMKHLKHFPRHHPPVQALSCDGITDSTVLAVFKHLEGAVHNRPDANPNMWLLKVQHVEKTNAVIYYLFRVSESIINHFYHQLSQLWPLTYLKQLLCLYTFTVLHISVQVIVIMISIWNCVCYQNSFQAENLMQSLLWSD